MVERLRRFTVVSIQVDSIQIKSFQDIIEVDSIHLEARSKSRDGVAPAPPPQKFSDLNEIPLQRLNLAY